MKRRLYLTFLFFPFLVLIFLQALGCQKSSPQKTSEPSSRQETREINVTVREIKANPEAYKDKLVSIKGYGVMAATVPLPPGYVGLDTRYRFVDAEKESMVAKLRKSTPEYFYKEDKLRLFKGYIRIFEGEIGPPQNRRKEKIPYFEIVSVK